MKADKRSKRETEPKPEKELTCGFPEYREFCNTSCRYYYTCVRNPYGIHKTKD